MQMNLTVIVREKESILEELDIEDEIDVGFDLGEFLEGIEGSDFEYYQNIRLFDGEEKYVIFEVEDCLVGLFDLRLDRIELFEER